MIPSMMFIGLYTQNTRAAIAHAVPRSIHYIYSGGVTLTSSAHASINRFSMMVVYTFRLTDSTSWASGLLDALVMSCIFMEVALALAMSSRAGGADATESSYLRR